MKTLDHIPTKPDSVLAEVRRIKEARAASFGFDVTAMARALQAQEFGDPRFVTLNRDKSEQGGDGGGDEPSADGRGSV